MASLALGVRFTTVNGGISEFVASSTTQGYRGASALVNGRTYRYRAESADLSQWEWGSGVWSSAGRTLARTAIADSSASGARVNFSAAPQVGIVIYPDDVLQFDDPMSLTVSQQAQAQRNIGVQEVLTGDRVLFVNASTGNDGNDGLTPGSAFATIQRAVNIAYTLNINRYTVYIQLAPGTYSGGVFMDGPFLNGLVRIVGDVNNPANCVIAGGANHALALERGARAFLQGVKVTSTNGFGLVSTRGSLLWIDAKIDFGSCYAYHMVSEFGAQILITSNYDISGAPTANHMLALLSGVIYASGNITVKLSGTPSFPGGYAAVQFGGNINVSGTTFIGSATGPRYSFIGQGNIFVNGAGPNYLPGNSPGVGGTNATGAYL